MEANTFVDTMFRNDRFSQWLGIQVAEQGEGYCTLTMTVREEMCNGYNIAHGGITYALADSALAIASNSYGRQALSIETSIAHLLPVYTGDVLIASTKKINLTYAIGVFEVSVTRATGEMVALFKGTVYRKK